MLLILDRNTDLSRSLYDEYSVKQHRLGVIISRYCCKVRGLLSARECRKSLWPKMAETETSLDGRLLAQWLSTLFWVEIEVRSRCEVCRRRTRVLQAKYVAYANGGSYKCNTTGMQQLQFRCSCASPVAIVVVVEARISGAAGRQRLNA